MKLETIILCEVTQDQKDKSCIFSLTDVRYLCIFRNVFILWNTHGGQDFSKRPLQVDFFQNILWAGEKNALVKVLKVELGNR